MKRIIYSSVTKFIAFVLMLVCAFECMRLVTDCLIEYFTSERELYAFEESFENSSYIASELNSPIAAVHSAYFNMRDGRGDKNFSNELKEALKYVDKSEKVDYIIEINGNVIKSDESLEPEIIMSDPYCASYKYDGDGYADYTTTLTASYYWHDLENITDDSIVIYTSLRDKYANESKRIWNDQKELVLSTFSSCASLIVVFLAMLIFLICTCGKQSDGSTKSIWLDKIPAEIHLALLIFWFGLGLGVVCIIFDGALWGHFPKNMTQLLVPATSVGAIALIVCSLLSLIRQVKCAAFLKTSIIFFVLKWSFKILKRVITWCFEAIRKFAKLCLKSVKVLFSAFSKKTALILLSLLCVYTLAVCFLFFGAAVEEPFLLVFFILTVLFAAFFVAYRAKDFDGIKKGAEQIRNGNLSYSIAEPKSDDMKELAQNINQIAKGLDESVSAKLRAERLKTELITNVSHDLKTPLTSIINYTELLSKVDGLPEEASDYVSIIAKKSDRLKTLTQDLFDISKVQSGNETITFERLDASLLINQSLGEHDGEIAGSGLKFCVDTVPDLYINADGRKMSRVVANLISNILKYTMKGTRVFVTAREDSGNVVMEFKNVASYPMEFDAEEISGRFVRGDESRSEDGNGLGLAIAKSYTEACGGEFSVVIDGDLFKVLLRFEKLD